MLQFIKNKRPTAKNVSGKLAVILKGVIGNSQGRNLKLGGSFFNYVSVTKYKRAERFEIFI